MRFLFQITNGPRTGNKFLLRPNMEMIVGRTELADYAVPGDANMSSRHFCLRATDSSCSVEDIGSTNGTLVNGKPISRIDLSDGDTITAGSSDFELRCEQPSKSPPVSRQTVTQAPPPDAPEPPPHVPPVKHPAAEEVVTPTEEEHEVLEVASRLDSPNVTATYASPTRAPDASAGPNPPSVPDDIPPLPPQAVAAPVTEVAHAPSSAEPTAPRADLTVADNRDTWPFEAAFLEPNPVVRSAALFAAAVTGQTWILEHCRNAAAAPSPENFEFLLLLAILGEPGDLVWVERVLEHQQLGTRRFDIVAAFGNPTLLPQLLDLARSPDRDTAAGAAAAFSSITGYEFPSTSEEGGLDTAAALDFWTHEEDKFREAVRWSRGVDIGTDVLDEATLSLLDMRARSNALIRAAFHGLRQDIASMIGWPQQPLLSN